MSKLGLFAAIAAVVGGLTFATFSPTTAAAEGTACAHKEFKTEMVKEACAKGQKEAKDVMKKFMKEKNIKSCNQCHSKLAPSYDLKPDGLEQFKKLGGK